MSLNQPNKIHQTPKIDEGRAETQHNWRGDWTVNSRDRWQNLKVIRNRHQVRESVIKPDKIEIVTTLDSRSPVIESLARMAFDELQRGTEAMASNLYADSLANMLAVQLLREYSSERLPPAKQYVNSLTSKKLAIVLDLIESDLSEDLSLKVLASAVGLSEYYFLRMFKQSTGLTPHQYVINQRIERAKELLQKTDMNITEIAYLLGFSTPAHFTHHFRRKTGRTPREMR